MPEMMINPTLLRYSLEFRQAELERGWAHRRELPELSRRRLPAISWAALPALVRGWLFPAPRFGAGKPAPLGAALDRAR